MGGVQKGFVLALVVGVSTAGAGTQDGKIQDPWFLGGVHRQGSYTGNLQAGSSSSGSLRSTGKPLRSDSFGTMMRSLKPDAFRGKRVRLRARVRTQGVQEACGLWMRVDSRRSNDPHGFDNMDDRPLRGTRGWTEASVVLDVPRNTTELNFGFLLSGQGAMWVQDLRLEVVPPTVPSTNMFD